MSYFVVEIKILKDMANSKFRLYSFLDLSISIIGIALCAFTVYWLYTGVAFEFLLFCGTLGAVMTVLGTSLFIDLIKFKNRLNKRGIYFTN
ncbi:hypothetical protein [Marinoscillum pacificum]|uniref:hypothetical protein n=1 Tax=Marinoscillum pacificum TaxID=392723 RepID=UPI0021579CCC|nr:hypothetical protein [Marinoscillum pacificum]